MYIHFIFTCACILFIYENDFISIQFFGWSFMVKVHFFLFFFDRLLVKAYYYGYYISKEERKKWTLEILLDNRFMWHNAVLNDEANR